MIEVTKEDQYIVEEVEKAVCDYFEQPTSCVLSKTISRQASLARGYAWYILHYDHEFSLRKIAKIYSRADRGVRYLIARTKYIVENQRMYKEMYEKIKAAI